VVASQPDIQLSVPLVATPRAEVEEIYAG